MKAGQRVIITTGEYSDYGIRDSFVVLKTFSFDEALSEWLGKHGDEGTFGYDTGQSDQDFLKSLRERGLVADEPLNEVHLHEYGCPEPSPAGDAADAVPGAPGEGAAATPTDGKQGKESH